MKKTKIHWCAVFVLAAFLLFTVSSCIEPGAGSSGVFIDITSDSIGLTSDQDGYFTGSGSIEISKGKAVSFEYDVERTMMAASPIMVNRDEPNIRLKVWRVAHSSISTRRTCTLKR
jgi:hypothetical protein